MCSCDPIYIDFKRGCWLMVREDIPCVQIFTMLTLTITRIPGYFDRSSTSTPCDWRWQPDDDDDDDDDTLPQQLVVVNCAMDFLSNWQQAQRIALLLLYILAWYWALGSPPSLRLRSEPHIFVLDELIVPSCSTVVACCVVAVLACMVMIK